MSVRQVSRWENGHRPTPKEAQRLFALLSRAPAPITAELADALGLELPEDELPAAPPASPAPASPPHAVASAGARASSAELRAAFDAIILSISEERDVLPRHLRAFAVRLFEGAHRLGVSPRDAAALVAKEEPKATP